MGGRARAVVPVVMLAALAGLAACGSASSEPHYPDHLVFHEEFDEVAGTQPDPSVWRMEQKADASGSELQCYTDSPSNIGTDGQGHLVITAMRQEGNCSDGWYRYFTSARISTEGLRSWKYGRFEIRAKVPDGVGTWPTFWGIGDVADPWPEAGEIDVMETAGRLPTTLIGTIHGPQREDPSQQYFLQVDKATAAPLASAFHTYGVVWEKDSLTWYLDGRDYGTITRADAEGQGRPWVWDHPFYLILNLAVGGEYGGSVPDSTVFPQGLAVDWIRIYQ